MPTLLPTPRHARRLMAGVCLATLLAAGLAQAEKADRLKSANISSDRGGTLDIVKQRTEFNGNVILSKGSMLLKAERMDVRETADGYYQAYASGETGKQVQFRQGRDVPGETIEGNADQLEYDSRSDTVRFVGNASVRHMRGPLVIKEITGAAVLYDNRSEVASIEAGPSSPQPNGRARIMLLPPGAAEPAASSAPLPLQSSPSLQPSPRKPS